jgi:hypothetical protein
MSIRGYSVGESENILLKLEIKLVYIVEYEQASDAELVG